MINLNLKLTIKKIELREKSAKKIDLLIDRSSIVYETAIIVFFIKLQSSLIDQIYILTIETVHNCRSANVVGIRNVNTVLLNGKIRILKSL